jgi:hypothetical protein
VRDRVAAAAAHAYYLDDRIRGHLLNQFEMRHVRVLCSVLLVVVESGCVAKYRNRLALPAADAPSHRCCRHSGRSEESALLSWEANADPSPCSG